MNIGVVPCHLLQMSGQRIQRFNRVGLAFAGIKVGEQLQGCCESAVELHQLGLAHGSSLGHVNDQSACACGQPLAHKVTAACMLIRWNQDGWQSTCSQPLVEAVVRHAHAIRNALNRHIGLGLRELFAQAQRFGQAVGAHPFPIAAAHWKVLPPIVICASKQIPFVRIEKLLRIWQSSGNCNKSWRRKVMNQTPEEIWQMLATIDERVESALQKRLEPIQRELDELDDFCNGLLLALAEVLPHIWKADEGISRTLAKTWGEASRQFDQIEKLDGQHPDFDQTLELLRPRKVLYDILLKRKEFGTPAGE
jgi:hypothetical protein